LQSLKNSSILTQKCIIGKKLVLKILLCNFTRDSIGNKNHMIFEKRNNHKLIIRYVSLGENSNSRKNTIIVSYILNTNNETKDKATRKHNDLCPYSDGLATSTSNYTKECFTDLG